MLSQGQNQSLFNSTYQYPQYYVYYLVQNYIPTPALLAFNSQINSQQTQKLFYPFAQNQQEIYQYTGQAKQKVKDKKIVQKNKIQKQNKIPLKNSIQRTIKKFQKNKNPNKQTKLDFRVEWKNQNRNIVPNILNQMLSFLLKKKKSQTFVQQIIMKQGYAKNDDKVNRFYQYMKLIKQSVSHYISEGIINMFFQIHEPNCKIYSQDEQIIFMKICRILIKFFLNNDAILIVLTSRRMSQSKRMAHLIARDALLRKFLEISSL